MAEKFKPGIPANFAFDPKPVENLGDYLDEPSPRPVLPARRQVVQEKPPVIVAPEPRIAEVVTQGNKTNGLVAKVEEIAAPSIPVPVTETVTLEHVVQADEARAAKPKAPRREISMTPETLRMSDELLDMIRRGSGQRDTKANEMFHALVLAVWEARNELDLHTIPKRGRWGSPTARAYPLELKNAFLRAILQSYRNGEVPSLVVGE